MRRVNRADACLIGLLLSWIAGSTGIAATIPETFTAEDGLQLHGQLALPSPAGRKVPAVLLLVGSGVVNRYEDIGAESTADGRPTLLFKGIEDRLLAAGIGVFTYDKRGVESVGESFQSSRATAEFQNATAEHLASDALRAYDFVRSLPGVDPERIALLGHSEGTLLAQRVAEQRPEVRALYLLGVLSRSMADGLAYQDVTNTMRGFYLKDADQDGYLTQAEYEAFVAENARRFPELATRLPAWSAAVSLDQNGDGRISEAEARFFFEQTLGRTVSAILSDELPWTIRIPRLWYRQYLQAGSWLERRTRFCARSRVFQGEVDIQTPYEDALALRARCRELGTPLRSFHGYAGVGHAFSPRIGYRGWLDTEGPMDARVQEDIAREASLDLR